MDLRVTTAGLAKVELDGVRYPLFFSVLGIKEWAEHQGREFKEVLASGWNLVELDETDLFALMRIGLVGGELRRHLCEGGTSRIISDETVWKALTYYSLADVYAILLFAWNQPPTEQGKEGGKEGDDGDRPQVAEAGCQTGQDSSE